MLTVPSGEGPNSSLSRKPTARFRPWLTFICLLEFFVSQLGYSHPLILKGEKYEVRTETLSRIVIIDFICRPRDRRRKGPRRFGRGRCGKLSLDRVEDCKPMQSGGSSPGDSCSSHDNDDEHMRRPRHATANPAAQPK